MAHSLTPTKRNPVTVSLSPITAILSLDMGITTAVGLRLLLSCPLKSIWNGGEHAVLSRKLLEDVLFFNNSPAIQAFQLHRSLGNDLILATDWFAFFVGDTSLVRTWEDI